MPVISRGVRELRLLSRRRKYFLPLQCPVCQGAAGIRSGLCLHGAACVSYMLAVKWRNWAFSGRPAVRTPGFRTWTFQVPPAVFPTQCLQWKPKTAVTRCLASKVGEFGYLHNINDIVGRSFPNHRKMGFLAIRRVHPLTVRISFILGTGVITELVHTANVVYF